MQSNFWTGCKKFGPAQNILGPVKGQGIHRNIDALAFTFYIHISGHTFNLKCHTQDSR